MASEEARLALALVAQVVGTRPEVSVEQIQWLLSEVYGIAVGVFSIHRGCLEDFIVVFNDRSAWDLVLHAPFPTGMPFQLRFRPWLRQSMASTDAMLFRVLVDLRGIPAHAWMLSTAERILGVACNSLIPTPETVAKEDLSCYRVVAWCVDPGLIPVEVDLLVPEPDEPYVEQGLFLRPEEMLRSRQPCLRYKVMVRIREVQDWHRQLSSSSSDGTPRGHLR